MCIYIHIIYIFPKNIGFWQISNVPKMSCMSNMKKYCKVPKPVRSFLFI